MNVIVKVLLVPCLIFLSSSHISGMAQESGKIIKAICHSCTPFAKNKIALVKSALFYASMDPRDARVPRVFVQTHGHIASLSDWKQEHWQEFGKFEKMLGLGLKKAFNAELVNIACLMNLAGEEGTHTHWHFITRLPKPITVIDSETNEEHVLEDPCYGKAYDMNGKNYRSASDAIIKVIIKKIQQNLDLSMVPGAELKVIK